ncbi:alpha/beta hydrolase [Rhizobium sp. NFACC06-2]|uniref:alpha/beta hydrolase n=1 Tax=Rhizobium sp. NFACC06-2 TaxID=1566264 RepID=UPI000876115C|nr:alpha/beta hydrolase [Rhizobium sp. NFACC06-2]SCY58918.1 Esterase/lipase superfamily enzyme [Rhizobium sp. NFACC06-2]
MANIDHVEWLREGRDAWNGRRKLVKFKPDLAGVDFREVLDQAFLSAPHSNFFSRYDFSEANLRNAKLIDLDFSKANFKSADLSHADLTLSSFDGAAFDNANLNGVVAAESSFQDARFPNVEWTNAILRDAYFAPDFSEADSLSLSQRAEISKEPPIRLDSGLQASFKEFFGARKANTPTVAPKKEPTYLVTFATNRNLIREREWVTFGEQRDSRLHYGACQVLVPSSHKVGSLGSPLWKRLLKGDDRLQIRRIYYLTSDLYWQFVHKNFSELFNSTPPTVVIHGYNVGFEQAVLWAAQIGYDLGLMRGINLFSWPSRDQVHAYQADEAAVEASKYHLASYLLDFIENAGGRRINVLAHSMGCRCLAGALEIIGSSNPEKLKRFNHLIFAAADVDQDTMRNVGAHVIGNSGSTTSYVCSRDKAVQLSAILHQFARVGFLPPVFLMDSMDTVEVEKGGLLELGHSYVSEAREILMDMHQILKSSTPPEERFAIKPGVAGHWVLKN